jgi:serine/threonine protein phosphatase PrpC
MLGYCSCNGKCRFALHFPGAALYVWKQLSPSVQQDLAHGIAFGMTDVGTVRPSNEDNFYIDRELGLLAVADGMGGHEAGEVASSDALIALARFIRDSATRVAGESIADFKPSAYDPALTHPHEQWTSSTSAAMTTLHHAVEFANQQMYRTNRDNLHVDGGGMGTTLTGIWQPAPDGPQFVFHVGDTRLYRYRQGKLTQLTRDQTMYQKAVDAGILYNLPGRNLLLQALGPSSGVRPDLRMQTTEPGDLYLLCSDGLHSACDDEQLASILGDATDLESTCATLIDTAKRNRSRDNITVVLLQCKY